MDMKPDMIEHIKKHPMWYGAGYLVLLGVLAWLFQSWPGGFWGWLRETPNGYESGSTTVRNLGLIVAGLIALPLTLWRIWVADRQAKAAHLHVETSQRGLLNERYQKGAEMLGSQVLSVRLGGIYALARLAREYPEEYHVQIMRLLCAFIRRPSPENSEVTDEDEARLLSKLRLDLQEIMKEIGQRTNKQIEVEEQQEEYSRLDLHSAKLSDAFFHAVNFSNANFVDAVLKKTLLKNADLTGAVLVGADLTGANLSDSNLTGAEFSVNGKLPAIGLTQRQLDAAIANPDNPPRLDGVLDAETGEQLVWGGKPVTE